MKVYEIITERIVAMLDRGVVPWRKAWTTGGATDWPVNISGRKYRGINVWLLWAARAGGGYGSNVWLTYKQAQKHGGKVRPGEHGTPVIFWKRILIDDEANPGEKKWIPLLRYFTAFNLDQTDGVKLPKKFETADVRPTNFDPIAEAESIVEQMPNRPGITRDYPSDRAYYQPAFDKVVVPMPEQFGAAEEFYATLFHELGHSTGHESRCKRPGILEFDHFGSDKYAREELVAEMTSAYLLATAGIEAPVIENTAAYIASWKSRLTDDPKAIVIAAAQAQKAADYILGVTFENEESTSND